MQLCHASLMVRGLDEPDAVYGLVAEAVEVDGRRFAFFPAGRLYVHRRQPHHRRGRRVLQRDDPRARPSLAAQAARGRRAGWRRPTTGQPSSPSPKGTSNRLPPLVATYPVLSRAWYTANDFTVADLSDPRHLGRLHGWAATSPAASSSIACANELVGRRRSGRPRTEQLRDGPRRLLPRAHHRVRGVQGRRHHVPRGVHRPHLGDRVQLSRVEGWPGGAPRVRGRTARGAQGFFINTTRARSSPTRATPRGADPGAFDSSGRTRTSSTASTSARRSFFMNSDMMATGEPSEAEIALLEPFRGEIPDAVFGPAWTAPVTDGSGQDRAPLRRANELLMEAGWRLGRDGPRQRPRRAALGGVPLPAAGLSSASSCPTRTAFASSGSTRS